MWCDCWQLYEIQLSYIRVIRYNVFIEQYVLKYANVHKVNWIIAISEYDQEHFHQCLYICFMHFWCAFYCKICPYRWNVYHTLNVFFRSKFFYKLVCIRTFCSHSSTNVIMLYTKINTMIDNTATTRDELRPLSVNKLVGNTGLPPWFGSSIYIIRIRDSKRFYIVFLN